MAENGCEPNPKGGRIMTDKEALQAVTRGERLPQPIVRCLL